MSNSAYAEIYFVAAMMILIFVISGVSVYFFFKTYKKEMKQREMREQAKKLKKAESEVKN